MSRIEDVPSPIDLRLTGDATEWERTALQKRPWRTEFFRAFADQISQIDPAATILELGSGPGFLAQHVLSALPATRMVLLDFSAAMHDLARVRLSQQLDRVKFFELSFRDGGWAASLGKFDVVVTNQAVHELRHKRYAVQLHKQVRSLLTARGQYLVCDHYAGDDGMRNTELYMSVQEQAAALSEAGFESVQEIKRLGGLVLHSAA